ncbi:MAG: hypothetical protein IKX48_09035 [Victivallales bacterium]|nr:hypothetical protein [Victivallales bacterium]MBR5025198.1 hypothetical protein [Victivallales bacterium]
MADDLQALLNKINEEGLKKAEQTKADIIAKAQAEAKGIIKKAQEEADDCRAKAQADSQILVQKGEEALRQAARDMMLSLRQQLQSRVKTAVLQLMDATLDAQQMPGIIAQIVESYLQKDGNEDNLELLVNKEQLDTLSAAVKAKLADNLKDRCEFSPAQNITNGFKLAFKDNDVLYDFTDQALADAVASYVGPRIAAALSDKN